MMYKNHYALLSNTIHSDIEAYKFYVLNFMIYDI